MKKILKALLFIFAFLVAVPTCMAKDYLLNIEEQQTYKESEDKQVMLKKEIASIDKKTGKIEVEVTLNNLKSTQRVHDNGSKEIWIVLDRSGSMHTTVENANLTRKEVVNQSSKKLIEKILDENTNTKIGIIVFGGGNSSLEDAKILSNLSNDKEQLISELNEDSTISGGTNIEAGIVTAYNNFTEENNKKIIFLLTDGQPNNSLNGYTNIDSDLKNRLISINQSGVHIVSIVTGVTQEYEQETIKKIFGTPGDPTVGTFYNIQDSDISNIIENNVYNDITTTFEQPIHDITIKDSFLKETLENFTFNFVENSKGDTDKTLTDNTLNLTLDELAGSSKVTLKYNLTAKNMKNDSLKGKSFKTNDKVVVTYKDINNNDHEIVLDTSPSISFIEDKVENPDTGLNNYIIITVSIALVIGSITYLKFNKRKEV